MVYRAICHDQGKVMVRFEAESWEQLCGMLYHEIVGTYPAGKPREDAWIVEVVLSGDPA